MEEFVGSIPIRSTKYLKMSGIRVVNGNLKQKIDPFDGNSVHSRKTVFSQRLSKRRWATLADG